MVIAITTGIHLKRAGMAATDQAWVQIFQFSYHNVKFNIANIFYQGLNTKVSMKF